MACKSQGRSCSVVIGYHCAFPISGQPGSRAANRLWRTRVHDIGKDASMSCLEMELNKAGSCYAFDGQRGWGGLIETKLLKLLFLPFQSCWCHFPPRQDLPTQVFIKRCCSHPLSKSFSRLILCNIASHTKLCLEFYLQLIDLLILSLQFSHYFNRVSRAMGNYLLLYLSFYPVTS